MKTSKKKVNPKDQTAELNRMRLEFLKRNTEKYQNVKTQVEQNEKKRDIFTSALASLSGNDPRLKQAWDSLYRDFFFDESLRGTLTETVTPPAADTAGHLGRFLMARAWQAMAHSGDENWNLTKENLNEKFLEYLCQNAREIFTELTHGEPAKHLLVGIDVRRTKEAILAEVAELLTQHQSGAETGTLPKTRLKWLAVSNEMLEVWDLWERCGQRRCFSVIARRLHISESTARARWRMAYRHINKRNYAPGQAGGDADALCAACKDQAGCYQPVKGVMDFIPCPAYLKLAGKQTHRERTHGNLDAITDRQSFESYRDEDA